MPTTDNSIEPDEVSETWDEVDDPVDPDPVAEALGPVKRQYQNALYRLRELRAERDEINASIALFREVEKRLKPIVTRMEKDIEKHAADA